MKKVIKICFVSVSFFFLAFGNSLIAKENDFPAWMKKLPEKLYINELCIIPEEKDGPVWVELWNHTKKEVNLKGYIFETEKTTETIADDFIIKSEHLGVIIFYPGNKKNLEFEKSIPENSAVLRLFGKKLWETDLNGYDENLFPIKLIIEDLKKDPIAILLPKYDVDLYKKLKDKNLLYSDKKLGIFKYPKEMLFPGISLQLIDEGKLLALKPNSTSPGFFLSEDVTKPELRAYFTHPSIQIKNELNALKRKSSLQAGIVYLSVNGDEINFDLDEKNGWTEMVYDLTYDDEFKQPILKNPDQFTFDSSSFSYPVEFTFNDYLYLIGKTLYSRIGRKNSNGKIIWSNTEQIILPNSKIRIPLFKGVSLSKINNKNEINYRNDLNKVKRIKVINKKISEIIETLGILSLDNPSNNGRIEYIKFRENLEGFWLAFSIYGMECLPYLKPDESEKNKMKKVKDFSFLKGVEKIAFDWSGIDFDQIGGLSSVLEKLPEKPIGLKLAACDLSDLSPLAKLPLEELDISRNRKVCNLKPITGLHLKKLNIQTIGTVDLSPLLKCKSLEEIILSPEKCKNIEILKEIPSLKSINNLTVTEFFDKIE